MSNVRRKLIVVPVGRMNKVCDICGGSGMKDCYRCAGTGTFYDGSTCPHCHGSGKEKCNVCNGYGYYDD